jgi:uncharacterized Rmd1/YagE family protein
VGSGNSFQDRDRLHAHAWFVGERIDVRALERMDVLATSPLTLAAGKRGCAMLFRYGAVVLFELEPAEEAAFLETIASFVRERFPQPERESADIAIQPERDEGAEASGTLSLRDASVEKLQVVAHVLAKSAVLSHHEGRVAEVFDRIEPLAEGLRRGRERGASSRDLLRQIGDVLLAQTRTVGRVEVAEKPELTWDRPDLDLLFERLSREYELRDRDAALGRKLELVWRTAETLHELLQNRRALRVEWYIVALIAFEIGLTLYDWFVRS